MARNTGMSLSELCASLRRGPHTIRLLQQGLGLPVIPSREGYPGCYRAFLDRVIFLRVFGVPLDDIASLFTIEKKLMQLLKVDTTGSSSLWYLAFSEYRDNSPGRLLLTRFDLASWISDDGAVQSPLDFGTRNPELFGSAEMGEDIRHVYALYRGQAGTIAKRLRSERGVVRDALEWVSSDVLRKA